VNLIDSNLFRQTEGVAHVFDTKKQKAWPKNPNFGKKLKVGFFPKILFFGHNV